MTAVEEKYYKDTNTQLNDLSKKLDRIRQELAGLYLLIAAGFFVTWLFF